MPEVPEEQWNAPRKLPCRWRFNRRFEFECTWCHNKDQKTCPEKKDEDADYDVSYHIGGGF